MNRTRAWTIAALVGVASLTAASCGDDDSNETSGTTAAQAATTAGAATTSGGGGATTTAGGQTTPSFDPAENEASAPGVTEDTITIGLVTSVTGNAASTFADTADGVRARLEAENAKGGVYGRRLVLEVADDQSSPQTDLSAVQSLVEQKDSFAIVGYSPYLFGGFRYLQENGIPVVGSGFDGPEWHQQPNTNMFSYSATDSTKDAYTIYGEFLSRVGVTKMAGLGYGNSPSSSGSIKQLRASVEQAGIEMAYENLTVPFGGVDFTTYALDMKSAGIDGAACSCVQSSNLAMFTAIKQAQIPAKAMIAFSGPDNTVFGSPQSTSAAEGAFFQSAITPIVLETEATKEYVANLEQYAPSYEEGFPSFGQSGGYVSADLLIRGLWEAGQNPTRESFIEGLSGVSDYDADGLLATKIDFDRAKLEELPDTACTYFVQVKNGEWTVFDPEPICGERIPGSAPD